MPELGPVPSLLRARFDEMPPLSRFRDAPHALDYLATGDPEYRAEAVEVVRAALERR